VKVRHQGPRASPHCPGEGVGLWLEQCDKFVLFVALSIRVAVLVGLVLLAPPALTRPLAPTNATPWSGSILRE
jgi:hypothetical protein